MNLEAPPERIFPLLCPVREYDWIPEWRCGVIHSRSGFAEDGCVFQTDFPHDGPMTWVVSVYEPPRRIEFVSFVPGLCVMRLRIRVTPRGEGAGVEWRREFLSLNEAGDEHLRLNKTEDAHRAMMERLESLLKSYLACSPSAR